MSVSGNAEGTPRESPLEQVSLEGQGIHLIPWGRHHAAALAEAANDPGMLLWYPLTARDATAAAQWIDERGPWIRNRTWSIDDDNGALLGGIGLYKVDPVNVTGEVGYWVAPGARGRNVAAHAISVVCAYAFTSLGLERIELYHGVENTASCRVAATSGFALEGTLRRSYRYGDGLLHDEHLHSRLISDP